MHVPIPVTAKLMNYSLIVNNILSLFSPKEKIITNYCNEFDTLVVVSKKIKPNKLFLNFNGKEYNFEYNLSKNVELGDTIKVSFEQKVKSTYKDLNKDGKRELVKKEIIDYKLTNASF